MIPNPCPRRTPLLEWEDLESPGWQQNGAYLEVDRPVRTRRVGGTASNSQHPFDTHSALRRSAYCSAKGRVRIAIAYSFLAQPKDGRCLAINQWRNLLP